MQNYFAKDGARALQQRIKDYWQERGYDIQVDVVPSEYDAKVRSVRYDVRSQLRNGMPPRRKAG